MTTQVGGVAARVLTFPASPRRRVGGVAARVLIANAPTPSEPATIEVAGAIGAPQANLTLSADVDAHVQIAGNVGDPSAAFALSGGADPAHVALSGVIDSPVAAFDLLAASTQPIVALAGVIGDPESTLELLGPYVPERNRYGSLSLTGSWGGTFSPAVTPPPATLGQQQVVAIAHGPVTMNGTQPVFDVTTRTESDHRTRIVVRGKDVTYFRGIETPTPAYQLVEPFGWGGTTLDFPQIAGALENPGIGDLAWLRPGANVLIQRVDPDTNTVVATDYRGIVIAINVDGGNLSAEVGGHATGRAALRDRQSPVVQRRFDVGRFMHQALNSIGLTMKPRLGPTTGIQLMRFGGTGLLDYMNELAASAVTEDGDQWTVMPNDAGVYRMALKDRETVAGTVYVDDARNVANLRRDLAEEPNRIFASGVGPKGVKHKFAAYPGLLKSKPAPYPFANGRSFGPGTTNADTDTGDGISVMVWRLQVTGYLNATETPGGYDNDARRAIRDLQRDAGVNVTGNMNRRTWSALFDQSATGYTLRKAHILPAAQTTQTQAWRRTASGSLIRRNPNYDSRVLKVDRTVSMGAGFAKQQIRTWARGMLASGDNWVGTINLTTGAIPAGVHTPGQPIDSILRTRAIRPGMNLWLPQFMGGILVHVSGVIVDATGAVSVIVDTKARDSLQAWEVIQRNRDSRNTPQRSFMRQHRSSQFEKDFITFDSIGGRVDETQRLTGGKWNVFPVVAGQAGTIARLRLDLGIGSEYAVAVFGRRPRAKALNKMVPNPLAPEAKTRWTRESLRRRLDRRFVLLYAAGSNDDPCGYWPDTKSDSGQPGGASISGIWDDDAGFGFATFIDEDIGGGVLWVAIWPRRNARLRPGRIMWPQLEEGM